MNIVLLAMSASPVTENPLNMASFFKSPIATFAESLEDVDSDHISIHDLLEAYATMSSRIKATASLLQEADTGYPALGFLREHATTVYRCLYRDIRRALADSCPTRPFDHVGSISYFVGISDHEAPANMKKQVNDVSAVCHAALVLVSNIFKFTSISAVFVGMCKVFIGFRHV